MSPNTERPKLNASPPYFSLASQKPDRWLPSGIAEEAEFVVALGILGEAIGLGRRIQHEP